MPWSIGFYGELFMDDNRQFEDIPDNADADTGDYISSEELEKAVKRRKKWIIIGILAVLVIAGAALGVYFGFFSGKNGTYYFSACEIEGEIVYTAEELSQDGIDIKDSYFKLSGKNCTVCIFGVTAEGTITFNADNTFIITEKNGSNLEDSTTGSYDEAGKTIRLLMSAEGNVYFIFKK